MAETAGSLVTGAVYVSPTGDDANPGTMAQPLKTIARARDLVRAMTAAMTATSPCILRGGTYPQAATLAVRERRLGEERLLREVHGVPGEQPIITGGQPITGWTLSDAANNIYTVSGITTPLPAALRQRRQSRFARAARTWAQTAPPTSTGSPPRTTSAQTIQVAASEVGSWNNLTKVEMHLMTGWGDNTLRLASVSDVGQHGDHQGAEPGKRDRVRPTLPALGRAVRHLPEARLLLRERAGVPGPAGRMVPGRDGKNVLSYKPRSGEDMTKATVVAPTLETILSITGTSTADQAGYLWFQGITFAHSTYLRPSQSGFCDAQAGQYNLTATTDNKQTIGRPPAGVSVTNANHIHFERNIFTQMGATGLDLVSGTHDDMIVGNVITEIAGNGISIGKFVASETTEYHVAVQPDGQERDLHERHDQGQLHPPRDDRDSGRRSASPPATRSSSTSSTTRSRICQLHGHLGRVRLDQHRQRDDQQQDQRQQRPPRLPDPGGLRAAMYTLSNQQPASEMQYNYLHDYQTTQWADYGDNGIYMDEQTAGYTVAHNVLTNSSAIPVVHQNKNGSMTIMDNGPSPTMAQATIMTAGIEPAYADIKTLTIPAASF